MYLFAILSSLICLQLISTISSGKSRFFRLFPNSSLDFLEKDTSDTNPSFQSNVVIPKPIILDNESDEEDDYHPRSTSFLRFGRELPPPFLRFGRSQPTFLRFGRNNQNVPPFLRFGRKGEFLRFG
jgi:hypothetical protein